MKRLAVNFVSTDVAEMGRADSAKLFGKTTPQAIDNLLWSDSGYKPAVSFLMAYTADSILLRYNVAESSFKADYHRINEPVYKDSCVEFFIAFNNEPSYYNLEFNALGTVLAGFGRDNVNRLLLDSSVISQIQSHSSIGHPGIPGGVINWELTLKIPFSVFFLHQVSSLQNISCRGNFYKCGDDLPQPHFLSWNPVTHPFPNFHLPDFFGEITFV